MTEKYILTGKVNFGEQYKITDSETNYAYKNNKYDKQKICDLLNKLTDENEQLKSDNKCYVKRYSELFDDYIAYKKENEQLKQQLRHLEYRFTEYRNKIGDVE